MMNPERHPDILPGSMTELNRLRTEVAVIIITASQDCAKQFAFDAANQLLRKKDYPPQCLVAIVTEVRRYEHAQKGSMDYRTLSAVAEINDRYDEVTQKAVADLRAAVERSLKNAAVVRPADMSLLYTAVAMVRQAAEIRQEVITQLRNRAPALCAAVLRIASYTLDRLAEALVRAIAELKPWSHGHVLDLDPLERHIAAVFDPFVNDTDIVKAMTGK